jgi:hypothetical protein
MSRPSCSNRAPAQTISSFMPSGKLCRPGAIRPRCARHCGRARRHNFPWLEAIEELEEAVVGLEAARLSWMWFDLCQGGLLESQMRVEVDLGGPDRLMP